MLHFVRSSTPSDPHIHFRHEACAMNVDSERFEVLEHLSLPGKYFQLCCVVLPKAWYVSGVAPVLFRYDPLITFNEVGSFSSTIQLSHMWHGVWVNPLRTIVAIYFETAYFLFFTSSRDLWRRLNEEPPLLTNVVPTWWDNTYVDSCYYWIKCHIETGCSVLEFDVHREAFKEISMPTGVRSNREGNLS